MCACNALRRPCPVQEAGAAAQLARLTTYRNLQVLCSVADAVSNLANGFPPGQVHHAA